MVEEASNGWRYTMSSVRDGGKENISDEKIMRS